MDLKCRFVVLEQISLSRKFLSILVYLFILQYENQVTSVADMQRD